MKLIDDKTEGALLVRSYSAGALHVGNTVLHRSCLIKADRIIADWRPQSVAELTLADLEPVFELEPEIVVLGCGERQQFPEASLTAAILSRGIGCEVMNTGAACRTYNVLVSEGRKVVAALLLAQGSAD